MMSDDMLSQDEIDALLRGTSEPEEETKDTSSDLIVEEYLSSMEQDALGEIGNISFGSSATALSTLLNQKVEITTPAVSIIDRNKLTEEFPHPYVAIEVEYTEGFSGTNLLVIKQSDASIIADLMLGGDGTNPEDHMGEIQLSAVQEAMNQMMGSAATSMSTVFSKKVDISPPTIDLLNVQQGEGTDAIPKQSLLVKISFRLKIGSLIDSSIMQLLQLEFAKDLVHELMNPAPAASPEEFSPPEAPIQEETPTAHAPEIHERQNEMAYAGAAVNHQQPTGPQHFGGYGGTQQANVQPAMFSNFDASPVQSHEPKNLDMLMDIPLHVTVELGRTNKSVKDILELTSGSIIELDKLAGEPVDILVNSRLIAKGEVVVIDENFGVRITDIVSQSDRIKKLK
ncbi:flagellar motor switch phosphatase FliY [Falsibacillus albus]|uniref:Flagellar motor switch phosphatase FliY n=1 Tax=Falsibacillus albus TaxID=2478915 RepID=A0A3L7JZH9_9BACI|nr:flagellar motor switch phosphatase FliY [Falsibacillus albus]RLQ95735.1 flagellar motor switch phosphatase FliY [Falsibacillus albus]